MKILLLFLLIISINLSAQNKFNASVYMGPVIPISDFKNTDHNLTNQGYAETGYTLSFDGDYFLHNRVAVSLRFHFGNSPVNQGKFIERLHSELSEYYSKTDTVKYDINFWQWATPLLGIKVNYPIVLNKIYIEAGVFSGICFLKIPEQNMFFNDVKNKQYLISQNIEKDQITLPLNFNAGMRFRVNQKVDLRINAEYFMTETSYTHVHFLDIEAGKELVEIDNYKFNTTIQTINATIGLTYHF
jgi:hypothetical protein